MVIEVHNAVKNYLTLRPKKARSFLDLYSKHLNLIDICTSNGPIFWMNPESYHDGPIPALLFPTPKEASLNPYSKIYQTLGLV